MDVSLLLGDLHGFLVSYPGGYWKQQTDDTPAIFSSIGRIQDPQASELVPYIRKLLNSGVGDDAALGGPDTDNNNSSNGLVATAEKKKMPWFTKCDHKALVEIFKKIGQKERTKQGLLELFSFKLRNPHVDLEPFMVSPVSNSGKANIFHEYDL